MQTENIPVSWYWKDETKREEAKRKAREIYHTGGAELKQKRFTQQQKEWTCPDCGKVIMLKSRYNHRHRTCPKLNEVSE